MAAADTEVWLRRHQHEKCKGNTDAVLAVIARIEDLVERLRKLNMSAEHIAMILSRIPLPCYGSHDACYDVRKEAKAHDAETQTLFFEEFE